jgi:hypothetical protein
LVGWLVEVSVCSELTGPQFDAEVIDGIANAHTAIAAMKSKTLFFEGFFITTCSLRVSADVETNGRSHQRRLT